MDDIEIGNEDLTCTLRPQLGGAVLGLNFRGKSILRAVDENLIKTSRQAANFALLPYSNRVSNAALQWLGRIYRLAKNNADEPHSIHGVGWQRPWVVKQRDKDFLLLSYEHTADESWPFDFAASQALRAVENELRHSLSITNKSNEPTPVGLGWHPYFIKRENTVIDFKANGIWQMGADRLPSKLLSSKGLDQKCSELSVDHCFEGWSGCATLTDKELTVTVLSNLNYLVVYTSPSMDSVAIEPVSHVNNAINMANQGNADYADLGVRVLLPGQSFTADMTIRVEGHQA